MPLIACEALPSGYAFLSSTTMSQHIPQEVYATRVA